MGRGMCDAIETDLGGLFLILIKWSDEIGCDEAGRIRNLERDDGMVLACMYGDVW